MSPLRCEECFHANFLKSNKKPFEGRRWWRCSNCGHIQLGYRPFVKQQPRELYVDIETSPNLSLLYDLKVKGYVNPDMILKDWFIISWSAQWMNCYNHKSFSGIVSSKKIKDWIPSWINDTESYIDSDILKPLRDLLDEADLVWGHNYKKFDRKKINTRLLINQIPPPEKYKMIDTLTVARGEFAFSSSRLDEINKRLGNNDKHKVDLEDWKACLRGDIKTMQKILNYNVNDVKSGIAMTKKMREWINPFPKVDKYIRRD